MKESRNNDEFPILEGNSSSEASGKITYERSATLTAIMELKKTDPLDTADVNANFDQIDQELGGRAVTLDFYKVSTDRTTVRPFKRHSTPAAWSS